METKKTEHHFSTKFFIQKYQKSQEQFTLHSITTRKRTNFVCSTQRSNGMGTSRLCSEYFR